MNALDSLRSQLRSTATLASAASLLGWDEQTYMPPAGGPFRAEQQGMLAGMIHGRQTDPRLGGWLAELEGSGLDPDSAEAALVREARRDFDLATKLPQRLVEELSEVTSLAQQAWVAARKANDFAAFEPHLTKIVALKREEAAALGEGRSLADPYDALLDQYEAHATTAEVAEVFENLRPPLVTLVADIADRGRANDAGVLTRTYPVDAQRTLGEAAAAAIGFDFDAGRLDVTAHPFCTDIGPGDVRLTTRYDERFFPMAFFGTLHEAGHGLYEQGLPHDAFGTPLGQAASLGIHESQSRMWENLVGRSRAFWGHWFPQAQAAFPGALGDVDEDAFYRTINRVEPSFIRVEADEVTYNLHVMLRFDLER
ncbi:MAG: carboxypeptidase M32, partial [Planctomycetota bacterium]